MARLGIHRAEPAVPRRRTFVSCFLHQPLGVAAAVFLVGIILASALAPLIAPYNANTQDLTTVLSG
ncbi:MAG: hypothetical protein ACRDYB_08935, partial [Acidimicrobiales bacterium]